MISDQSIINNESLLLEHSETVVKLLNSFGKKSNVSSKLVLQKLVYLYYRLSDFLAQEEDEEGNKSPKGDISFAEFNRQKSAQNSKSLNAQSTDVAPVSHQFIPLLNEDYELSLATHMQDAGENHNMSMRKSLQNVTDTMSKIQLEKLDVDVKQGTKKKHPTPIKSMSLTTIECGICRELIPVVDSNFTLAMTSHVAGDTHQSAIALEKTTQEIMSLSPKGSQKETMCMGPHISYDDVRNFYCELCKSHMSGIDNAKQHIIGSAHTSKLAKEVKDADVIVLENDMYFCNLCSAPLGNCNNALDHKQGKNHRKKVIARLNMEHEDLVRQPVEIEDRVWSKFPSITKIHKKYFDNVGDSSVFCRLCATSLPKREVNILSHIHGKQHSKPFNNN